MDVYDGETYVSSIPSEELLHMRKEIVDRPMPACELVIDITSQQADLEIVLQNHLKERVIMKYKPRMKLFLLIESIVEMFHSIALL